MSKFIKKYIQRRDNIAIDNIDVNIKNNMSEEYDINTLFINPFLGEIIITRIDSEIGWTRRLILEVIFNIITRKIYI